MQLTLVKSTEYWYRTDDADTLMALAMSVMLSAKSIPSQLKYICPSTEVCRISREGTFIVVNTKCSLSLVPAALT